MKRAVECLPRHARLPFGKVHPTQVIGHSSRFSPIPQIRRRQHRIGPGRTDDREFKSSGLDLTWRGQLNR
jgi:hypothetical protein